MAEPEDRESSYDDDDSQTIAALSARKRSRSDPRTDLWAEDEPIALVRHRSSRHTEGGSSAAGEGTSASQAQAPTIVNNSPPPAGAASSTQLSLIPVQIIDDSSPEAEDRVPLLDAPREESSDIPVLEQIAPDSIPISNEANPKAMPAVVVREPPAEESDNTFLQNPNAFNTEDAVAEAVEAEAVEPALNMVGQELPPPAPQVAEAGELADLPEPVPEAASVAEPPTPSTLERC
ncbi:uncharacterized protein LOC133737590 [Rosa rugosa]|uniref:uncharacterized protein LOC133737590 n=1 Tax=Rosa rugosa TaxID=74645 RepID=UPI002B4155F6|nr:uncharacterized protein LOC133737590 [Rosa rugosa]